MVRVCLLSDSGTIGISGMFMVSLAFERPKKGSVKKKIFSFRAGTVSDLDGKKPTKRRCLLSSKGGRRQLLPLLPISTTHRARHLFASNTFLKEHKETDDEYQEAF